MYIRAKTTYTRKLVYNNFYIMQLFLIENPCFFTSNACIAFSSQLISSTLYNQTLITNVADVIRIVNCGTLNQNDKF